MKYVTKNTKIQQCILTMHNWNFYQKSKWCYSAKFENRNYHVLYFAWRMEHIFRICGPTLWRLDISEGHGGNGSSMEFNYCSHKTDPKRKSLNFAFHAIPLTTILESNNHNSCAVKFPRININTIIFRIN